MARVQIFLEDGETIEDAEEMLSKAFVAKNAGQEHAHAFHQPAAQDVFNKMIQAHAKLWEEQILPEIFEVLEEDSK